MSTLAAIYLKLDIEIPIFDQESSRAYLQRLVRRLGSVVYRQDVDVEVRFRQGSLEVLVVIAGSVYVAIGSYGAFRSGIDQIIKDAKALKNILVASLRKDGVAEDAILQQKRLATTPDRVRRVLRRIDRFERDLPELSEDESRSKLERLLKSVQKITDEMDFPEDIDLLMKNLDERFRPRPGEIQTHYRKSLPSEERPTFLKPVQAKLPIKVARAGLRFSPRPKLPPTDEG